jgi:hypothetical protein
MIDLLFYVLRNGVLPDGVNPSTLRGLGEARGNLLTFSDTDPHAVQLSANGVDALVAAWDADGTDVPGATRLNGVLMVMHADATDRTIMDAITHADLALVDAETEAYDERHLHALVLAVGDTVSFERMNWIVFSVSDTDGVYLAADSGHKIWVPLASVWKLSKVASPVAPAPVALVCINHMSGEMRIHTTVCGKLTADRRRMNGEFDISDGARDQESIVREIWADFIPEWNGDLATGFDNTTWCECVNFLAAPVALAHPMDSDPFAGLPDNGTDETGDTSAVSDGPDKTGAWYDRVDGRNPWPITPDPTNIEIWHDAAIEHVRDARRTSVGGGESDRVASTRLWLDIPETVLPTFPFPQDAAKWPETAVEAPEVSEETVPADLSDVDPDELVKAAQEALKRPTDVGYFGDRALWSVWGVVGTQGPDPDALEASNWRVTLADLQGRAVHDDGDQADDPAEYVDTEVFSHWAYGYVTHMVVRVLVDTDGPVETSNLTATFVRAVEIAQSLQDYPVLDESDYSELESEGQEAAWDAHLWSSVEDELTKALVLDDFSQATLNLTATLSYSDTTVAELLKNTAPQDIVREFYYGHESTSWREESSSFYNEQHDVVMSDMLSGLFVHDHVMCWSCEDSVKLLDNGTLDRHTTLDIEASRAATPIGSGKLKHIRKHCHASGTNAWPDHYHVMSFVEGYLPEGDIYCTTKASEARDAFLTELADTRDSLECLAEGWIDGGCPDSDPCDHCQASDDIAAMLTDFKAQPPNPAKGDVRVTYNDGRRLDIVHKIERVFASDCQI